MKIIKNNPDIPVNKIYPYKIVGGWGQSIDCDIEDLKKLRKEIKKKYLTKRIRHDTIRL